MRPFGGATTTLGLGAWLSVLIRSHTSARWTGISALASKPSRTLPPRISITVTLSSRSKPLPPPTITDSCFFRDKTNIAKPPYLGTTDWHIAIPDFRWHTMGEQKHLHYGARREHLHHRPSRRLDFRNRFPHVHAGDFFDLVSQRFA